MYTDSSDTTFTFGGHKGHSCNQHTLPGTVSYRFLERTEKRHSGITSYRLDWEKKTADEAQQNKYAAVFLWLWEMNFLPGTDSTLKEFALLFFL